MFWQFLEVRDCDGKGKAMKASTARKKSSKAWREKELARQKTEAQKEAEAKRRKEENLKWWDKEGYAMIQGWIEDACEEGKREVDEEKEVPEFIIERLKEDGYQVEFGCREGVESYCDHQGQAFREAWVKYITISW